MKEPSTVFLFEIMKALHEAEHQNVAEHMLAGMLWAMYPEWFDKVYLTVQRAGGKE